MLGWLKRKVPGIAPNNRQQRMENNREQRMEKEKVIQGIEKVIADIDTILGVPEKTSLLQEIQNTFPEENITHLHDISVEYYRELLVNLISFSKHEVEEVTTQQQ